MKPVEFSENYYSLCEIKGKEFLFTDIRVKRDSIPKEYPVAYELRGDDESGFEPCQVKPYIMVNFFGTIIGTEDLPFDEDNECYLEEDDFILLGSISPSAFLERKGVLV